MGFLTGTGAAGSAERASGRSARACHDGSAQAFLYRLAHAGADSVGEAASTLSG